MRVFCGRDAFRTAIFRSFVTSHNRCSLTSRIFRRLLCSSLTLHPERQCSQQPVATCVCTLHRAFVFSGSLSIDAGILIRLDKEGFNGSQIASLSLPLFFLLFSISQNLWAILYTVTVKKLTYLNFKNYTYRYSSIYGITFHVVSQNSVIYYYKSIIFFSVSNNICITVIIILDISNYIRLYKM